MLNDHSIDDVIDKRFVEIVVSIQPIRDDAKDNKNDVPIVQIMADKCVNNLSTSVSVCSLNGRQVVYH